MQWCDSCWTHSLTRTQTLEQWLLNIGGSGFFLTCEDFGRMFTHSFPACVFFIFFFISLCMLILLFRPGSVHSGSASWDVDMMCLHRHTLCKSCWHMWCDCWHIPNPYMYVQCNNSCWMHLLTDMNWWSHTYIHVQQLYIHQQDNTHLYNSCWTNQFTEAVYSCYKLWCWQWAEHPTNKAYTCAIAAEYIWFIDHSLMSQQEQWLLLSVLLE